MSIPGAFDKERQALLTAHGINPDHCVTSNVFLPTLRVETLHTTPSGETFLYTENIPISVDEYQRVTGKHFQRNHDAIADPEPCFPPPPCDACRTAN